jgi:hypothetical protein
MLFPYSACTSSPSQPSVLTLPVGFYLIVHGYMTSAKISCFCGILESIAAFTKPVIGLNSKPIDGTGERLSDSQEDSYTVKSYYVNNDTSR